MPSQCVFSCKVPIAEVAAKIPFFHMNTLVMPLQVRLSDKFLAAAWERTRKRIYPAQIMRFHVSFEVIASTKKLTAAFDFTLIVRILPRRHFTRRPGPWHVAKGAFWILFLVIESLA